MKTKIQETEKKGTMLSEYVENLQKDVEYVEHDKINNDDHLDEEFNSKDVEIKSEPERIDIVDTLGTNELADMLVNCFNVGFNVFARAFSQGYIDTKEYEARPDELASIRKPLASYLKTKKIDMSPGTVLLIAVLVVYAPKTIMLVNAKKQAKNELNQENEQDSNV